MFPIWKILLVKSKFYKKYSSILDHSKWEFKVMFAVLMKSVGKRRIKKIELNKKLHD